MAALPALKQAGTTESRPLKTSITGSIIAIAISAALSGTALAQEDSTGQGAREASLEEITVTGSRIRRTTDFDTANPTTVVDSTQALVTAVLDHFER